MSTIGEVRGAERVVALADIHGVLPALEAVLAEPDVRSADVIALCGDLAAGPQPRETLDLLRSLGERAVWVRGNAERELAALARGRDAAIPDAITPWAAAQLREADIALFESLPVSVTLEVGALGPTVFCHATPRDDEEVALVDSSIQRWTEVLSTLDSHVQTVVCGHTHMPYARLVDRRLVVNPGSVGMPYGTGGAHWAMLGPSLSVQLRRTEFDADAACARIAAESSYEGAAEWADYYVRARASDVEALRVFGPRDGRPVPSA